MDLLVCLSGFFCRCFNILATSIVISGQAPTCDSVHSSWLSSAAPVGDLAVDTMNWYLMQSDYPNAVLTSPCPILLIPSARLGSDEYQFYMSFVWLRLVFKSPTFLIRSLHDTELAIMSHIKLVVVLWISGFGWTNKEMVTKGGTPYNFWVFVIFWDQYIKLITVIYFTCAMLAQLVRAWGSEWRWGQG